MLLAKHRHLGRNNNTKIWNLARKIQNADRILWYNLGMSNKPLIETNAYLRDSKLRAALLLINVSTSTAVELVRVSPAILKSLKDKTLPQFISPLGV